MKPHEIFQKKRELCETFQLELEVKSPLFIGDGNILTPLSCIKGEDKLYFINVEHFLKNLSEREREAYIRWLEDILGEMERLKAKIDETKIEHRFPLHRQYRELASRLSLAQFIKDRLGREPVSLVKKFGSISYSTGWMSPLVTTDIHTFIKNADSFPFIPGSELKGAWRTSLLYTILKENEDKYKVLQENLNSFGKTLGSTKRPREKVKEFKDIARQIENILRNKGDDSKFDLLRFLHLGDASLPAESLCLYIIESIGASRPIRTVVEGIKEDTKTQVRLVLFRQQLCFKKELGLEKLSLNLSPDRLLHSAYLRSKEILSEAALYFKDYPQMQKHILELEKANEPSSPLLRLGWGQGFLSTTINYLVKQKDQKLYQYVREGFFLIRRQYPSPGDFPKTRRVVSDGKGKPLALPGWVKIRILGKP